MSLSTNSDAQLTGDLSEIGLIGGDLSEAGGISGGLSAPGMYDGVYEVTPSSQTQTLSTKDKMLLNDITVNPIPSNYGLITWNGSVITVS